MSIKVLNIDSTGKSENLNLSEKLIGLKVNNKLLKYVVDWQLNRSKKRIAKTKQRNEVTGSTRKIYAQKGNVSILLTIPVPSNVHGIKIIFAVLLHSCYVQLNCDSPLAEKSCRNIYNHKFNVSILLTIPLPSNVHYKTKKQDSFVAQHC